MVANLTRLVPVAPAFSQSFVVRTQAPGSRNSAGKFVPGTVTDTTLRGSVQPADGDVVQTLSEAERQSDSISIWAKNDVINIKPVRFGAEQTQGDRIIYSGFRWVVRRVWDYGPHGHQRVLAVKEENQNG